MGISTKERTEERVRTKTERYNRTMRNRYSRRVIENRKSEGEQRREKREENE